MATKELDSTGPGLEIVIRDESVQRSEAVEMLLKIASVQLTARDLIAERVRAECDNRLLDRGGTAVAPLVSPTQDESRLNGLKNLLMLRAENVDQQIDRAITAFGQNAFLLLVDDRQVESLDEPVDVRENSVVTFLRLTPLVGG